MKKLFFAALFLVATSAQAEMVSIKKSKCSLFGNLKIKVNGLERYGSVGRGYLKANLPMRADCDAVLSTFNQTMGRGTTSVSTDFDQYEVRRQTQNGGDNDKRDYECKVYKRSVIKVVFPAYSSMTFKNTHERLIDSYYGRCR
ncbi:MAG: hypothetical protein CME70_14835 [Halobacteriovorax sp.]|nr:hypothetical protein [Halobacteriovorax sp.]|tara:strand:+ start:165393 stop:165821 length:429 start_codon:yes stop_codon:yes gene_type:complete